MPVKTEYICDTCGESIEWNFYTIDQTVLKEPDFTYDFFVAPEPPKIFCSMECLAKDVEYFAKRYNRLKEHGL